MKRTNFLVFFGTILSLNASFSFAQTNTTAQSKWQLIAPNATYLTGDTWQEGVETYRLYGVQSCLRGTFIVNEHQVKRDCGEVSMTMLAAMNKDLSFLCATVANVENTHMHYVVCSASLRSGDGTTKIDLGTALITTGFAFASLNLKGEPVHMPYLVTQVNAQNAHVGLWRYANVPDPNTIILDALKKAQAQQ
jgi:endonuclease YncB( thermonuclease family)